MGGQESAVTATFSLLGFVERKKTTDFNNFKDSYGPAAVSVFNDSNVKAIIVNLHTDRW